MNTRTVFSAAAAGALVIAAVAFVATAAIAAITPLPYDGPVVSASSETSAPPAPSTANPSPTPSAGATSTDDDIIGRPLRPGDVLVTRAQIQTFVYARDALRDTAESGNPSEDTANLESEVAEDVMDVQCMKEKSFYYNPLGQLGGHFETAAAAAFWGNTGGGDSYRWQDAGCHGASVHNTGNDNSN